MTFCFRFHTAPALLFAAIYACRWHFRARWMPLIVAGSLPVLALGVLDALTWGLPFQSVWQNLWVNIVEGRSRIYSVEPLWWYVAHLVEQWGAAVVPIGILFVVGARRTPLLGGLVVVHVLAHTLIAHKELRFLYPVMPANIVLVGLGTAETAIKMGSMLASRRRIVAIVSGSFGAWAITSAVIV